jgi:hypothetical protein
MSNVVTLLNRLFTALFAVDSAPVEPDDMSLHDWADLPPHHPSADGAALTP